MSLEKTPTFRVQPFGDYYLLQRIAVGGMAEIFKAKQIGVRGFEKIVVIKKILQHLSEDPEFVEMFEDEAKIAAQLTQANIVQIYELGEVDATLYITMEYIDGKNMRDVTRSATQRGIHLSIEQSVYLMVEVLKGLDYAHRKTDSSSNPLSIVHRDMSPQNIIVSYEGEVKILDFGIAKAASKISKTEAGVLKGKFSYMSPEQASGKVIDQTSDIYACGVILHELLTSERLFRAKTDMETLERVKEGKVPAPSEKNPDVPPELDRIVLKSLAKDQYQRYRSSGEFLTDLTRFSHEQKFNHSSQELSAFMKTLFAETISSEKENLLKALAQIPANATEQLQNAKTNIAFKRSPFSGNTEAYDSSKHRNEESVTAEPMDGKQTKARFLRILIVLCFLAAAALIYFQPQMKRNSSVMREEDSETAISMERPPPPPLPQDQFDNLKNVPPPTPDLDQKLDNAGREDPIEEKPIPKPTPAATPAVVPKPKPVPKKKVVEAKRVVEAKKPQKKPTPAPSPAPKKSVTQSSGKGSIDVIAPLEGFAQLFVNNKPMGTVPGPKARGIPLDEGKHEISCQTSSRKYSGSIQVKPNERITVHCQDLK